MSNIHSHSYNHTHNHPNLKGRNLFLSIFLNIIITVAQVIGGLVSGSLSLLSDALHNFTDVLSLLVSYLATVLSKKSASLHKTFGYKRAEILAAFVNAATLIIVAILLIKEAIIRFQNPQTIEPTWSRSCTALTTTWSASSATTASSSGTCSTR